ncbi:hypothetical protein J2S78_002089 [Salibacterium salarium]|uniref:hypothetical protein n=1 Tax=Salibacterium salarium TaxID=284579 RepID=UPI0027817D3D|nr:hypothetical protein [Salibacterium salarium]MDQ0299669.1 hypothetical protein [Salibacterium salarium]
MEYKVLYEVPPMRGIFETIINADKIEDAERKIRENPDTSNYRIKRLEAKHE